MNLEQITIENKVESEEERFKRLKDNTYKETRRLEDPEFYYPLIKLKGELEGIKAGEESGGFRDKEERENMARRFSSLCPENFYLLNDIVYFYDGYGVETAYQYDEREKDLARRDPNDRY